MNMRVLSLIFEELRSLLNHRKVRGILFVPPLIQAFVFAYAATFDVTRVTLAVWCEDPGRFATDIIERFADSPTFTVVRALDNSAATQASVTNAEVTAVLHIGPTFTGIFWRAGRRACNCCSTVGVRTPR